MNGRITRALKCKIVVSNTTPRKLPYPLDRAVSIEAQTGTEDAEIFEWPSTDSDETVVVTLRLTLNEYVALASAVDVGSDIAYASDAIKIWWIWCKAIMPSSFCEQMIDCILNDADTQNAFKQFLEQNGFGAGNGNPDNPDVYEDNPLMIDGSQIASCNNDNLFGAITQTVDLLNTLIEDIFENWEAATARTERIAAVLEAIPLTNLFAIDDLFQFADQLLENLAQNYASQYTAALRDEYRCDLFCISKDTCQMDFQQMANYFWSRAGATFDDVEFIESVDWFIFGTFTGDLVVHAAHAIVFSVLAYGAKFFNIDMGWLSKALTSYLNDPDPDWATLCTECPPSGDYWIWVWDFATDGFTGWTIENGTEEADSIQSVDAGAFQAIYAWYEFGSTVRIMRGWSLEDRTGSEGSGTQDWSFTEGFNGNPAAPTAGVDIYNITGISTDGTDLPFCDEVIPNDPDGISKVMFRYWMRIADDTGVGKLKKIIMCGDATVDNIPSGAVLSATLPTCAELTAAYG